VRRLACEAAIVPIVLNTTGEVLDCGREHRVANRAQRRALRAMYRTCSYPGCDVAFDRCDIHHVIEWLHHGSTDLDNLLPLRLSHESRLSRPRLGLRATMGHGRERAWRGSGPVVSDAAVGDRLAA
jgi:hypothetical protein